MLVEAPPPPPFAEAVWVGGYWVWEGDWVWARGRWIAPPQPGYGWVHPYYENRDGVVIFVAGHWAAPGVVFVPPPPTLRLSVEIAAVGVRPGPRPVGPNGCFVPAPPGSRPGLIVPAPVGTPPAVVVSAPPVVAVGMRITNNVGNTTVINNHVNNVTNVTNVTIVAPAAATVNGRAVNTSVPAVAHLAAARPAVFNAPAPEPASMRPIPTHVAGRPPVSLPPAQPIKVQARMPEAAPASAPSTANERPRAGPGGNETAAAAGQGRGGPAAPVARTVEAEKPAAAPRPQPQPQPNAQNNGQNRKPAPAKAAGGNDKRKDQRKQEQKKEDQKDER
jgi:hypothetical protein